MVRIVYIGYPARTSFTSIASCSLSDRAIRDVLWWDGEEIQQQRAREELTKYETCSRSTAPRRPQSIDPIDEDDDEDDCPIRGANVGLTLVATEGASPRRSWRRESDFGKIVARFSAMCAR